MGPSQRIAPGATSRPAPLGDDRWDPAEGMARIDRAGRALVSSPGRETLDAYQAEVRAFVSQIAARSYRLTQERTLDASGRPRRFHKLLEVDRELIRLAETVLGREKDRLGILSRVDAIRGLIMDLYR